MTKTWLLEERHPRTKKWRVMRITSFKSRDEAMEFAAQTFVGVRFDGYKYRATLYAPVGAKR